MDILLRREAKVSCPLGHRARCQPLSQTRGCSHQGSLAMEEEQSFFQLVQTLHRAGAQLPCGAAEWQTAGDGRETSPQWAAASAGRVPPAPQHHQPSLGHPPAPWGDHDGSLPPGAPDVSHGAPQEAGSRRDGQSHRGLLPARRSRRFRMMPASQGWQMPRGGEFAQEGRGWQAGSTRGNSRPMGHRDVTPGMLGVGVGALTL